MRTFKEYALLLENLESLDPAGFERFIQGPMAVVMYSSNTCRLCVLAYPWASQLAAEGHPIAKVDIDHQPDLAEQAGLGTIPTFDIYHNGQRVERVTGAKQYSVMKAMGLSV